DGRTRSRAARSLRYHSRDGRPVRAARTPTTLAWNNAASNGEDLRATRTFLRAARKIARRRPSPVRLHLLHDGDGQSFDVFLVADKFAFAQGGVVGGGLFEAAAVGEDFAGAEVLPGEVQPHDVELLLRQAGVDVGGLRAQVGVEDLALQDGVGVLARDDLVGGVGLELVDDRLGQGELHAAAEAAVGEDGHGDGPHVVAVEALPLVAAGRAGGRFAGAGGGVAAAGEGEEQ